MTDTKKAFWDSKSTSFATPDPRDEFLHPEAREREPGPELTETQYLGFSVPEHNIHALCHLWHHPNLGVASGGAWAWQGVKEHPLECELFNWNNWVDDAVLKDDLHHFQLPSSYEVDVLVPLKRLRIRYADPLRDNFFDVELEAVAPAMVLDTGFHLEQPMRTRGTLTLAGRDYTVDGYTVRDRSWGQLRPETPASVPPISWVTGVFDPSLSFGVTGFDTEDQNPDWKGFLSVPGGDSLRGGWICRDGVYSPIVSLAKRTHRNSHTLFPETVEMAIADDTGYSMNVHGTVIAAASLQTWPNMDAVICLTRWECDGRVGYGDFQDARFGDYVRRFRRDSHSQRAAHD